MPSKSRGLRTSTGCLTCRKRRVKCDETRPSCKNCERVERDCLYPEKPVIPRRPRTLSIRKSSDTSITPPPPSASRSVPKTSDDDALHIGPAAPTSAQGAEIVDPMQPWLPFEPDPSSNVLPDESFFLDDSLFTFGDTLTPNFGPVEWYDLLAEDAINSMQGQTHSSRWNFDITSLSRRQSPRQSLVPDVGAAAYDNPDAQAVSTLATISKPWNTENRIELQNDELVYFEHFINVVAPILDLFDPGKHFASIVPHLALRNVGLLKSLLAVGACHMAIYLSQSPTHNEALTPAPPSTPASTSSAPPSTSRIAEQYYYETLQYLSQNLLYQTYTTSPEILVTAIMISTYEMYGTVANSDHSNWDRHLRGAFWIQRTMDSSGESSDGLQRAVWWAWLRQDIWAAFRTGRPALTIHQPRIPMSELSTTGLATRIIYIAAKAVQFAATPKEGDIAGYIEAGETLMRMLDAWKRCLPESFYPIPVATSQATTGPVIESQNIPPIWIHPPSHAAAIQTYHFARITILLNQPSTGGLNMYQTRFKLLRESTAVICGIAIAHQSNNLPSAFVSFQAVYAAALCAETQDRQHEILEILGKVLAVSKFPSRSILDDLINVWGSAR
ncbi:fungal-specific transcription factor domain-containing protein [Paraphoma chrysanthemicola]|uniref:Fungal-specific transcription factor domain-containing protein n=1 Tax=Paraphoma chrysanthemicola TaxID=798071 RepID=A0A8K0QXW4_9PLEO|nr:fungal-specific transcription factor domain-containing protein [Paraphoma chrysanthemicola]